MNNKIVNDKADILLYGLRTARQKKRMQYKGFEKKLKDLDREEGMLFKSKWQLGWIELNPPVTRGWKRYFVLRDDIARSKDAAFFQGILDKVNTTDYCSRRDFKAKQRSRGKKFYSVTTQQLKNSKQLDLRKVTFTDKEWSFFEERDVPDWTGKKFYKAFVFTEQWRFVLRIRPNVITTSRVRDEAIEQRLGEIAGHVYRLHLRPSIAKVNGDSYNPRYRKEGEKSKEVYRFKNMSFSQVLDAIKEE